MSRRTALFLALFTVSLSSATHAADTPEQSFAPVYEGPHVLSTLRLPAQPSDFAWSDGFKQDTNRVLGKYGWYVAELVLLIDATGQVRDVVLTESIPAKNLSATIVEELRRKKWSPAMGPAGAVPAQTNFRIVYDLLYSAKSLGTVASQLRRNARNGKPSSQYLLSRVMKGAVGINREGLDANELLLSAARGGEPRAMLTLGVDPGEGGPNPAADAAENRAWLLKAAQAGSSTAKLLISFHAWAERTDAGYARARHWLETANEAKEPGAAKNLAALLVSHSTNPEDWKRARELAEAATHEWHDRTDPDTLQIVAMASALMGDFKAAIAAQTSAIALAEKTGWSVNILQARLAAYQESRTVTEEVVMIPTIARESFPGLSQKEKS